MIRGKKITRCGLCSKWFRYNKMYTVIKEGLKPLIGKADRAKIKICPDCYGQVGYHTRKKER